MNRDDIIKMALEAGALQIGFNKTTMQSEFSIFAHELERFFHMAQAAEREEIYELVMFEPLKQDADLLMPESEVEENPFDDYFKSAEFRNSINNAVKATLFTICSEIKKRGQA
jgi:hypothetical protein